MKRVLLLVGQFVLFYVIFLATPLLALLDPLHPQWFAQHPTVTSTRYFAPEGLIVSFVLYLVILGFGAASKRLTAQSGVITTAAFLLAVLLGIWGKFGYRTVELF